MNLLSLLPWRRPRAAAARHGHADEAALPPLAEEQAERTRSCGWFDSSHDLQHGLSVREHASPDTLGRDLPLAHWLDLQLSGWRAVPSAAPKT
ncbi:MAG: hypothetical protein C0505_05710 [Leptothrix sp. (in: Bacteria)]|nr:hypothetical protein [Leptothrix sp. (in: b-proteobacteria)]